MLNCWYWYRYLCHLFTFFIVVREDEMDINPRFAALLLAPVANYFLYKFVVAKISRQIDRFLPDSKFKEALFKERGDRNKCAWPYSSITQDEIRYRRIK